MRGRCNSVSYTHLDVYKRQGYSLRGNAEEVAAELARELQERLMVAGVEVMEARLTHLAYATEIASAMLQRLSLIHIWDVPGNHEEVQVSYANLPQEVTPGTSILISDGLINLKVEETTPTDVVCRVMNGGELGPVSYTHLDVYKRQL